MSVRILMVGTALDEQGGVAAATRALRDAGLFEACSVTYVATNGPGGTTAKMAYALRAWLRCLWQLAFGGYDLLHVHTSSFISFWRKSPVFAMALLLQRPFVISLHGGAFREFYAACGPLGKSWIRRVMRSARRFLVLTDEWLRWAEATEPAARVQVIPNSVAVLPPLDTLEAAVEPGLLLFLGRLEREKGIFVLVAALAAARARGARWRLVCGGVGDAAGVRAEAARCGLDESSVELLGWIDGERKQEWLRRCRMLVLPSFIENMPVSLLEAFAYGKPVIATRVGGVPDVVTPGVDGWLVAPGDAPALADALHAADAQRERLPAMGRQARAKVDARYTATRVLGQIASVYRECTGLEAARRTRA